MSAELSSDTLKLIEELKQEKPEKSYVGLLIEQGADLTAALREAKIPVTDLAKKPHLSALGLHQVHKPQPKIAFKM